jgi:hypothetical protein
MKKRRHHRGNPLTEFLKEILETIVLNILWGVVKLMFRGVVHFIKFLF